MSGKVLAVRVVDGSKVVTAKGLELIEQLAANGHPETAISKQLHIDPKTLRAIRRRQPEVQTALDHGRGVLEAELVDILLRHARKGNVVAAIYLSKARCGWRDNGPVPEGASPTTNINILQLPAPLSVDDYRKAVDANWQEEEANG